MRRRFNWDRKYFYWGMTAFCVIAAAVLFYFALSRVAVIGTAINTLVRILAPFIWGLVICYLLSPMLKTLENKLFLPLAGKLYRKSKKSDGKKFARIISVLFCEIFLILLLVALVSMILPQILNSIQTIIQNSGTYLDNLQEWVDGLFEDYPLLDQYIGDALDNVNTNFGNWLQTTLLPRIGNMVTSITSGVYGVAKSIYNLIIGIIVSIYLLSDREGFSAAVKRLSYAVFSVETAERARRGVNFVDRTFMSFLNGKLLDSLIIGIICYIVCSLLQMPYTLLVSVIVGVTNIIPFFGPLIGAIPSAFIILMVNPTKCLIFVIFVIILQQIDGNIILGGGLFGFWGLLLGVPVFVVVSSLVTDLIEKKLKKEDLPWEIQDYKELEYIDPATLQVVKKASVRRAELEREKAAKLRLSEEQETPRE